ncbi:MAG: hypothetical protein BWX80_02528 [Candidatus Hydrogenedentes bacterium ADurb.Bin101]|nr:MAG: hypothetical protein BWX80_02528 [Candidatus Hydrogenedentes bacterium ADurb.Bin101]
MLRNDEIYRPVYRGLNMASPDIMQADIHQLSKQLSDHSEE